MQNACNDCGQKETDLIQVDQKLICAACKSLRVQRLQEGSVSSQSVESKKLKLNLG